MADDGMMFVCVGCCCGRTGHGGALAPAGALKRAVKRAYEASGLSGRVRLAFSECLGPCSESNVMFLYLHGQPLWFRRVNTAETLAEVVRHAHDATPEDVQTLPDALRPHSFAWTGGGIGPKPPIADAEPS